MNPNHIAPVVAQRPSGAHRPCPSCRTPIEATKRACRRCLLWHARIVLANALREAKQ